MAKKLPGTQQPNIIKPKSIVKVGSRGKVETAAIQKHPAPVERIWATHRNAQAKLNEIGRQLAPQLHKKR